MREKEEDKSLSAEKNPNKRPELLEEDLSEKRKESTGVSEGRRSRYFGDNQAKKVSAAESLEVGNNAFGLETSFGEKKGCSSFEGKTTQVEMVREEERM